jgi:hypothetical protein
MALYKLRIRWGRWEGPPGNRQYVPYAPGAEVDLSEEEAAGFAAGRLEPVAGRPVPAVSEPPAGLVLLPAGTVREVEEGISDIEDAGALRALAAVELGSRQPRKGVLRAVEARLGELAEDDPAEENEDPAHEED